tara:strand:- start:580 stop:1497 length:918 start_codon:yes stop_codon:yes gene_type:complete
MFSIPRISICLGSNIEINEELEKILGWKLGKIEAKTGIKKRYISNQSETTETLAIGAVKKIPDIDLLDVNLIISVTNTPSISFPTLAHFIHSEINTSQDTHCLGINSGCSGFVDALIIANNFLRSDGCNKVLVVTSDTYSKYIDPHDSSIRTLFSDGASAAIIEKDESGFFIKEKITNTKKHSEKHLCMKHDGKSIQAIDMNGPQVLTFAVGTVLPGIKKIISKDAKYVMVPHQAGKLVLDTFKNKIPENVRIYENYQNFGNLVSTSIPNLLYEKPSILENEKNLILSGFGVGLSHASVSLFKPT